MMTKIQLSIPEVDEILSRYRDDVGPLLPAYRNHVCRMLNYSFAMRDCSAIERQKLIIAGAFHDLGIWPDQNWDYLSPSIALAKEHLAETGHQDWSDEIARMIDMHHKIRSTHHDPSPLVELFRRADLVDVSFGLRRFGLPKTLVRQVAKAYPNQGFHWALAKLATRQWIRAPWNPMPMVKW